MAEEGTTAAAKGMASSALGLAWKATKVGCFTIGVATLASAFAAPATGVAVAQGTLGLIQAGAELGMEALPS